MATITAAGSWLSTTSGAALPCTSITANVGDLLVLDVAADNAGTSGVSSTSATITDAAGNTWTRQSETTRSPGGASNDGTTLSRYTCLVTNALAAATIDVNFSPNTASKAAILWRVVPDAGYSLFVHSAGAGAANAGTAWDAPTVSVPESFTIFGAVAVEGTGAGTGDSDTTNGSWSTDQTAAASTGSFGTSQAVGGQWKTVTATGNQSYGRTSANSRDWAANWLIIGEEITATLAATDAPDTASFVMVPSLPRSGARSAKILVQFDWPTSTTSRLWDGAGPWVDADLNLWLGAGSFGDLDEIETAINGEAATVNLTLAGASQEQADLVWLSYTNDQIVGAVVKIMIQPCDSSDQPVGAPEVRFTGTVDDFVYVEKVVGGRPQSTIQVPVVNKFTVRRLKSGAVLSDADQKARSAIINPTADPDLFAERVPLIIDRTITWPRWN